MTFNVVMRAAILGLLAILVCVGCAAHQDETDPELTARVRKRFGSDLLAKIDSGKIHFEGGNGSSVERAVRIVGATNGNEGVAAEYYFISRRHGVQGTDWKAAGQRNFNDNKGRKFDAVVVQVSGEYTPLTYYFDITEFRQKDQETIRRMLDGKQKGEPPKAR
jgi:adenosylmethionine-8-amino-7-oxononanoate aminotransferase